jgi:hypothetical protein
MPFALTSRRIAACVLVAALAACSARPFPVKAPESLSRALEPAQAAAAETRAPKPRIVSICYGNVINTPEEVLEEARYRCRDGEVILQDADSFWTPCGLLQPIRASFLCTPKPGAQ